jgi:hypothetical protein
MYIKCPCGQILPDLKTILREQVILCPNCGIAVGIDLVEKAWPEGPPPDVSYGEYSLTVEQRQYLNGQI